MAEAGLDTTAIKVQFDAVRAEVGKVLVGQDELVHRLLLALIADGHVLLEGVPGLAKTLAISTLAATVDCRFSRIQFTPDMLPGDVTGTQIFNPREGTYSVRKGPVFGNLILADEINRAPAKVQAALLEAMQE
ncbi:MAG: AAA family ATPase, partial [Gammaproteobacteria bacterium]|nr:AAA family ATPase [Gammaproteobacteria bacterium]